MKKPFTQGDIVELLILAGGVVSALWAVGIPLSRPRFLRHFSRHQLYSYTIEQHMKWGGGTYYKVTNAIRQANSFDKPLVLVAGDSEEFKLRYRAAHAMAKRSSYCWPMAALRHSLAMREGLAFKEGLEIAQGEELEKLRSILLLEAYREGYESIMPEVIEAKSFPQLRAVRDRIHHRRLSLAGQRRKEAALFAQ